MNFMGNNGKSCDYTNKINNVASQDGHMYELTPPHVVLGNSKFFKKMGD